ncbi:similar to Saccharomyces cerevisiae YGR120C COG2 Essential component of the conserved oligomeric Golgi complex (Cog1p through Cog8p) [Maudiozyma barnettii]|uniref:Similar to Saccharomyces cerevisiae YGR120C COG2 Essential component of the conserved oligomeric Golgi complex (Cog1p through Cog8p) n=1 Tax=Maudiozyma barnettii TaxID=61262 RepID=A0A8H2VAV0_9SACH|nr:Golgi transport complex subunit COG2 [Kazachstania barnettii]CAB4251872.1 similar to Saccharomyces cerevisiae YGR120C COG2 Essential component of the conserved oligomeric Golgi complex (Cog1p through Cog8p) [Kazachstania barnettii]CAD1778165.1 similar to Saccharomyces cerevisiae YGR120C COG2 Essential component of the conserved oligomeric Golgi complex (Cog1p through Cog8p) [Kazachstania barnettii]
MDFLKEDEDINLDLPETTQINRDLFAKEISNIDSSVDEEFNVDKFLMENNFHYMELDPLLRDLSGLSSVIMSDLLEQVSSNYEHYLEFFNTYTSEDNEIQLQIRDIKNKLDTFMTGFDTLTKKDIAHYKEIISDTVEYLRKLDEIITQLRSHKELAQNIALSKELSKSLHVLCGVEEIDDILCADLVMQLYTLISKCETMLLSLEQLNSPYIHHLYNEYQGIIQEFQVSLKILTERCLGDPTAYPDLSKALVSFVNTTKSMMN